MNKYIEAIEVLKKNYPDKSFSMLREAVDIAIKVLQEKANEEMGK